MKKYFYLVLILFLPHFVFAVELQSDAELFHENSPVFAKIVSAASVVKRIASNFSQKRHLSMLKDPLVSKGHFYYEKPDKLRWEVSDPVISGFAVNGKNGKRWKNGTSQVQTFKISRVPFVKLFAEQVFAWTNADFKKLQEGYEILVLGENPLTLKLVPISAKGKEYIDDIRIQFADDARYVNKIKICEKGEDFTEISFYETVVNGPIPKNMF